MDRALREAVTTASSYREQLQTFMAGSADAISHVQEGVILDTNPAWTQLFGFEDDTELLGTPIMDLFAEESHATLKGALVACAQARWPGDPLRCAGVDRAGSRLDVELNLETVQSDGEACIRISIVPTSRDDTLLLRELRDAVNRDPVTGLFTRQYLLESLQERIREPLRGGVRALAILRPDSFANVVESVGSVASEEVLGGLARILKEHVQPSDIYGRFGGTLFAALVSRGNIGDLKAWGESFCRKASSQLFELGENSVSVSCTVGIALVDGRDADIDETVSLAMHACAGGRLKGGDRVSLSSADRESTEIEENDRLWVPRIKQALIEKRFRLAHQPIASLAGAGEGFYDVLVRMVDEQGDEVLPGQFMAAAERNQLVKNIDRWVMGATISWMAEGKASRAFVRLSQPSIGDDTLTPWLLEQLESEKLSPEKLVLQVPEIVADKHLKATRDLAEEARSLGFGFAIEHFGVGARPAQVLSHVPMEFLKIDGSLMQGMSSETHLQAKVADLVAEAREKGISTIAERVEDANTMAVLWQLGVEYIQGYQVREPEVVLEEERPLG
jgi:diguanylate cyclase (GGDEF)-like protein/PAS domain S-box-containing protein